MFLQGTASSAACWPLVGIAIRLAQVMGAHRRKVYNRTPTTEDELWKRAFWCDISVLTPARNPHAYIRVLVFLDRFMAYGLGRPCAIQNEE